MSYWTRVLVLFDIAAWAPVVVGAIAWLLFFHRDPPPTTRQQPIPSPPASAPEFALPNNEPKQGDPGFVSFEDEPVISFETPPSYETPPS